MRLNTEAPSRRGRKQVRGIEIVRGTTEGEERYEAVLLFINGHHVQASPTVVALLAYLYDHLGRVIPYKELCLFLGHKTGYEHQLQARRHLLRQYTLAIKRTLTTYRAPYVLAVAPNVGYALCEMR